MRRGLLGLAVASAALLLAGCGATGRVDPSAANADAGKKLFQQKCASCHVLAEANAAGTIGPNLDNAFACAKQQGFEASTIRDVIRGQIAYAEPPMPADLVTGQDADDVAAYVTQASGAKVDCGAKGG